MVRDEVGKRHGRLVVLSRAGVGSGGNALWLCKCDCGKETTTMGHSLRSGNTKSCGCLHDEVNKTLNQLPFGTSARNRAISNSKANAKRRGYEWVLTDSETIELMGQNCFYCGVEPKQVSKGRNGNFTYNGLDRMDNKQGYVKENVVPCCLPCNEAKRTKSVNEFLDLVRRVYEHSISKGAN